MTAATSVHDVKIRELLLLGNTIDVLVAEGGKRGWTRIDVLRVVAENGWKLDPSGRVPRADRAASVRPVAQTAASAPKLAAVPDETPPAAASPLWTVLVEGRKHPVPAIKKRAERIFEQLQQLAGDIEKAEGERRTRDRLAQLDAERDRLRAELGMKTGRPGRKAAPINHGTYGGYQAHSRRGEQPCDTCATAKTEHMERMRAARRVQS